MSTGASSTDSEEKVSKKEVWIELSLLWLGTLLLMRFVIFLHDSLSLPEIVLGIPPLLFVYAPVWLCSYRKVDSWSYQLSIPAFRDYQQWWQALRLCIIMNLLLWPWYVVLYHNWVWFFAGKTFAWNLPQNLLLTSAFHFFYVAIPEEFFYRGYMQGRFSEIYEKKWTIFGTPIGWASVITSVFFAFGHSLIVLQWWHFAIFFPSLLFAWMRERSGGVVAGAMFHASCNIGVVILDTLYGIRSPL